MEIEWIKERINKKEYIYSFHGDTERQNDNLLISEVNEAILNGIILEYYSDSGRGESCLVAGYTSNGKPVHIVCRNLNDNLCIITVYIPTLPKFINIYSRVNMKKKCAFCGNSELKKKKTQYIYKHDNNFFIVNDVPCLECTYCGEKYFGGKVLENIENRFLSLKSDNNTSGIRFISVPVTSY